MCTCMYINVHVCTFTLVNSGMLASTVQLVENDIQSHQDHIDDIMGRVRVFRDNSHFQIDLIEDKGRELVTKYVTHH